MAQALIFVNNKNFWKKLISLYCNICFLIWKPGTHCDLIKEEKNGRAGRLGRMGCPHGLRKGWTDMMWKSRKRYFVKIAAAVIFAVGLVIPAAAQSFQEPVLTGDNSGMLIAIAIIVLLAAVMGIATLILVRRKRMWGQIMPPSFWPRNCKGVPNSRFTIMLQIGRNGDSQCGSQKTARWMRECISVLYEWTMQKEKGTKKRERYREISYFSTGIFFNSEC